ncbi:MAG TPA: R3H domain-containing nucleic acid-binding protein [Vicinamibacteria bacterium]|nr:R3H domain-containing nucleic acid-binding protein [Vicinamibacteria bacterium]
MSDPVFSGQDVPDAVASAARSLGLEAARLRYVVLDPGRPGGLGVSASPARIAVLLERRPAGEARPVAVPRSHVPEDAQPPAPRTGDVRADIRSLVRVLGEAASVDLSAEVEEGPDGLRVRLQGAGCAMLLEEEGEVFQAFEHVLQRAYRARLVSGRLTVECEGYRDHRDGRLRARALELVRAVEADGKPRRTEALNSYERRIVHMVVSEHPALETYSVGEGADRRVTIAPRRAPEAGGGPAEPPRD